jgi:integrase
MFIELLLKQSSDEHWVPDQSDTNAVKLAGFLQRYSPDSRKMIKSNLNSFLKFLNENNFSFDRLNQNVINVYLDYLWKQKTATGKLISNGTYNNKVGHLKSFLNHMGKLFIYKFKQNEEYGNIRLIKEDDFKTMLNYIEDHLVYKQETKYYKYLRDFIIFSTFYLTGLRKSEVLKMRHSDIFIEADMPVYQTVIKGGQKIKKEYPMKLYKLVRELQFVESKSSDDYIFTSKQGASDTSYKMLSNKALNFQLNTWFKKATGKKDHVTVHSIRNISGLAVQEITNDLYATRDHLNHKKIDTTHLYLTKVKKLTKTPLNEMQDRLSSPIQTLSEY